MLLGYLIRVGGASRDGEQPRAPECVIWLNPRIKSRKVPERDVKSHQTRDTIVDRHLLDNLDGLGIVSGE